MLPKGRPVGSQRGTCRIGFAPPKIGFLAKPSSQQIPVFCCTSLHIVFCFLLLFPFKESQLTPPSFPFLFLLGAFLELLCRDLRSLRRRLPRRLRRRSHQRLRQRSHQRRPKKWLKKSPKRRLTFHPKRRDRARAGLDEMLWCGAFSVFVDN